MDFLTIENIIDSGQVNKKFFHNQSKRLFFCHKSQFWIFNVFLFRCARTFLFLNFFCTLSPLLLIILLERSCMTFGIKRAIIAILWGKLLIERKDGCCISLYLKRLVFILLMLENHWAGTIFATTYTSKMVITLIRLGWKLTSMVRLLSLAQLLTRRSYRWSMTFKRSVDRWAHLCHWAYIPLT